MNNHCLVESGWLAVLSQWRLEDTMLQVPALTLRGHKHRAFPSCQVESPPPRVHGKSELLGRCAYLSRLSLLSLLLILLLAVSWALCFRFPHNRSSLTAMSLVYVTQIPRNPLVLPFRALPGDSSLSEPHFKEVTPAQTSPRYLVHLGKSFMSVAMWYLLMFSLF